MSTSLFLERFWLECRKSFKAQSKNYTLKNDIFDLFMTFSVPFWCLLLRRRTYKAKLQLVLGKASH